MHLLDANVIIAIFREWVNDHKEAANFASSLTEFAISDYVLGEILTVMKIKDGLQEAKAALDYLINNKKVHLARLTQDELARTIAFFHDSKTDISFVDASLIVMAKGRDMKLATLDKNLVKAGAEY